MEYRINSDLDLCIKITKNQSMTHTLNHGMELKHSTTYAVGYAKCNNCWKDITPTQIQVDGHYHCFHDKSDYHIDCLGDNKDDETFFLLECGFTNMKIKNTKSYKDYMKSYLKNSLVKRMENNLIGLKGYSKKNHVMNQKYIFF